MIVLPHHPLAFVHVPKAAGSSITAALAPLTDHGPPGDDDNKRGWQVKYHTTPMHATLAQSINALPDGYTPVGVARNPWQRMVCVYDYYQRGVWKEPPGLSLTEFARTLDTLSIPAHMKLPAAAFLEGRVKAYILRFERLEVDWFDFCARFGLPRHSLPHRLNRRDPTYNPTPMADPDAWVDAYRADPEAVDAVHAAWGIDAVRYGYNPPVVS